MRISISVEELQYFVARQLECRFPDRKSFLDFKDSLTKKAFDEGLDRAEYCYSHIKVRGYFVEDRGVQHTFFNHLNSDQYAQFLYYFSNSLWKAEGNPDLCSKLILLNRDLNGSWFSYKANLPDIFILVHPVGSVIGNRNVQYSDYLVIMQNVTINGSDIPLKLGKYLFLGSGSKIMGGGTIGNCVSVGANTLVRNPNISDNFLIYQDVKTGIVTQAPDKNAVCFAKRNYFR